MVDGGIKGTGVSWGLCGRTFLGWVVAFTGAALFSATMFSLGEAEVAWSHVQHC
jgi:phosphate/sulfate permease